MDAPAHEIGRCSAAIRSGTRTRSSISCTSSRSSMPTTTASATFPGLIAKLDYIAELGVERDLAAAVLSRRRGATTATTSPTIATCIPTTARSPTCERFIDEAHARGIRVITELVINHTSDQHPWFQRARRAKPGSTDAQLLRLVRQRPEIRRHAHHLHRHREARTGPGTRSPSAYYWHRFYSHQPDLNFDNPAGAQGGAERDALLARHGRRRAAARRRAVSGRARGHQQREPAGDARDPEAHPRRARSTTLSGTACCSPRPTSGRRTPRSISATATNATWRSTSR